jgi:hypothetical protein
MARARWWSKPKALVVAIGAALAFVVAFVANLGTVAGWFGLGTEPPLRIVLETSDPTVVHNFDATRFDWWFQVTLNKTGKGVLHDCKFTFWLGGRQYDTNLPHAFTIPEGNFSNTQTVMFFPPKSFLYGDQYGDMYLNCDKAGSAAPSRFTTPLNK